MGVFLICGILYALVQQVATIFLTGLVVVSTCMSHTHACLIWLRLLAVQFSSSKWLVPVASSELQYLVGSSWSLLSGFLPNM